MKIDKDYSWSTHIPLLNAILDVFNPQLILELGMGLYSTKLFLDYNPKRLICIEQDKKWMNYIKDMYAINDSDVAMHYMHDDIKIGTFLRQLTAEQKEEISRYYRLVGRVTTSNSLTPRLLFVDNYTCCRTIAINALYEHFDVIVYHDCEPNAAIYCYEYKFDENLLINYNHYILRTPRSWTGCFVRREFNNYSELESDIEPYIEQYCIEHDIDLGKVFLFNDN